MVQHEKGSAMALLSKLLEQDLYILWMSMLLLFVRKVYYLGNPS